VKRIAVAGVGYVGLTTAACLAELGHRVIGFDIDREKISLLTRGRVGFSEPGLPELVKANLVAGRLSFTTDPADAMRDAELAFICVGTPPGASGRVDMSQVEATVRTLARTAVRSFVTVLKSTMPPNGSAERVRDILSTHLSPKVRSSVVVNPEFLREGSAVSDFFAPDRVVIGAWDQEAAEVVASLYMPIRCPVILTDPPSAQLIKYASNAFLATKISFINDIAQIAASAGASIKVVAEGMGFDERIGVNFLEAGLGYGGSCFPKDVLALSKLAEDYAKPSALLRAVMDVNARQRRLAVEKLQDAMDGRLRGRQVCVLGLAFKANTDDVREAPALDVISALCSSGASVRAYDPVAIPVARGVLPPHSSLEYCNDAYEAATGSDAVFIATEWPQFRSLDWKKVHTRMSGHAIVDGRGLLVPEEMDAIGFRYETVPG
jgi:UDPglucose 6-dehydrogenase